PVQAVEHYRAIAGGRKRGRRAGHPSAGVHGGRGQLPRLDFAGREHACDERPGVSHRLPAPAAGAAPGHGYRAAHHLRQP
nr:hypothetical protein [Tanacetum cinerariifolium]